MPIEFYNPPAAILASGTKEGVELGGSKCIVSVDDIHNLHTEGSIFTEMSWGEFYKEEGIQDQIDTFTTQKYDSVREDPVALVDIIVNSIYQIINNKKLFYGIVDFEVDAFMNENCVIPGLKLDVKMIINLLEAHKMSRDRNLFPEIMFDAKGSKKIKIEFQGSNRKNLHFLGTKLEDFADRLRLAKGFATGIVCTSHGAANLYIMNDNIVFKEDEVADIYIDKDNITIIELGIQRELLAPISWFRVDIGIRSLETLELWDKIKDNPKLQRALNDYNRYTTGLVYKKFVQMASTEKIGTDLEKDFESMTPQERAKALKDMAEAIKILTKKYKE